MARQIALICSFWVMSLCALSAFAQQATDIYRVEVPVASQSEADRVTAAKANLGAVVVRVLASGAAASAAPSAALQNPLVQQAIKDAPNYLAKFSYSADETLILNYSPQAIQRLLQQAQLIAATATTAQGLSLYVQGVQDFAAFKQVQAYLKTVGAIRNLSLVGVEKDVLHFNLLCDGDAQLLRTTLTVAAHLQPVAGDAERPLSFRWQN